MVWIDHKCFVYIFGSLQFHHNPPSKLVSLVSLRSFYYVNWDDPIYDQFDDYMEKLEQEEEKAKQDQRTKGTVRINYKVGQQWDLGF